MAERNTGFALLAANSVQQAHDLAAIEHAGKLQSRNSLVNACWSPMPPAAPPAKAAICRPHRGQKITRARGQRGAILCLKTTLNLVSVFA